jgi:hypothetical protein
LVFNRPDTTKKVFEAIRIAKPPRLYISADGARKGRIGEIERVDTVREIATAVDWPCEVKTLFRDENLGCKNAVTSGIDWFFKFEKQGIILEDDCLPHPDFFSFCQTLLERYANDDRVSVITGNNFLNGISRGEGSYYFSRYNHVWGWASWRRAWEKNDVNITFWPKWKRSVDWLYEFPNFVERWYWEKTFNRMYTQKIDTWDYPWTASVWFHGGLTATPNVNLVSNIGFGPDSTHTLNINSHLAGIATKALGEISHPSEIARDNDADFYVFKNAIARFRDKLLLNLLSMVSRKVKKSDSL